jgi:hypothetical protein
MDNRQPSVRKFVKDGTVFIIRDGEKYAIDGRRLAP